jgi:hypothetical protein
MHVDLRQPAHAVTFAGNGVFKAAGMIMALKRAVFHYREAQLYPISFRVVVAGCAIRQEQFPVASLPHRYGSSSMLRSAGCIYADTDLPI